MTGSGKFKVTRVQYGQKYTKKDKYDVIRKYIKQIEI